MEGAQFARGRQPGSWVATREVDLTMIPEARGAIIALTRSSRPLTNASSWCELGFENNSLALRR